MSRGRFQGLVAFLSFSWEMTCHLIRRGAGSSTPGLRIRCRLAGFTLGGGCC
jgi:hypothetical protein